MVNVLANGDFNASSNLPNVLVGYLDADSPFIPGWSIWNNKSTDFPDDALWTSASMQALQNIALAGLPAAVLNAFKAGPGGLADVNVVEIRSNSGACGIYQFFDPVPGADASMWVFVISGAAYTELAHEGTGFPGEASTTTLQWEQVAVSVANDPIDEFVIYSGPEDGAWFYVTQPVVEAAG